MVQSALLSATRFAPLQIRRRALSRMSAATTVRSGPPLPARDLGHHLGKIDAKVTLTVFLDYTCPFSTKSFNTLYGQVFPAFNGDLRLSFYQQVQPWHPHSTMLHESAMAVAKLSGEKGFWQYSDVLFNRASEFADHISFNMTRQQIYDKLVDMACEAVPSIDRSKLQGMLSLQPSKTGGNGSGSALTQEVKWICRQARQQSIHVTPTTLVNGLLVDTSSSWTLEQWKELLAPLVAEAAAAPAPPSAAEEQVAAAADAGKRRAAL